MQLRAEINNSISSLKENLTSLDDSMSNFSITISNVNKGLQEHKKQTETELADLQISLASTQANHINLLNIKIDSLEQCLFEHKEQVTGKLNALQTSQANHTSQLNANLSQHNQQITAELTLLQTSLNSTHSKLDSLTATTAQLSSDHQQIQANISDVNKGLQEHKKQTETELADLQMSLASTQANHTNLLNIKIDSLEQCLFEHKELVTGKLNALQTSQANHASQLKEAFNASLFQHNQQITAELTLLQTSLYSTDSKLDSITATTAQLSSDHQQIQPNISDVECLDTEQSLELHQNMQDNFAHKLEKIQDYIEQLSVHTCGGTGGWRRVVQLDMTDPSTICPSGWKMTGYSKRTCGRATDGTDTCDSATFPVRGGEYTRICGRIRAYQYASPDAFRTYHHDHTRKNIC